MNDRDLQMDFTGDARSCQPTCDEQFPTFWEKHQNTLLIEHYIQYQQEELVQCVNELDLQFPGITDDKKTLLIDMLLDSRDVYFQHKFVVVKTRQKFHDKLQPNVESKKQSSSKSTLHFRENLAKLLTQLEDADSFQEMGDDDEMGSLFANLVIVMPKSDYVKLVTDARFLIFVTYLTKYSRPLEPLQ